MAAAKKQAKKARPLKAKKLGVSANHHKVPAKQWRKWCPLSRRAFNETYDVINWNQKILIHPKTTAVPDKQWLTTAWNVAWLVADNIENSLKNYEE